MYKILVFLALVALSVAGHLAGVVPGAVVYDAPEYPSASGYEYQHTVQTADYVNHASVSAPLNGFAGAAPLVRTIYDHPVAYAQQW